MDEREAGLGDGWMGVECACENVMRDYPYLLDFHLQDYGLRDAPCAAGRQ